MKYTLEDVDHIIDSTLPEMLRTLKLDILMISLLKRAKVLNDSIEDELKTEGISNHKKVSTFMNDLKTGPIERFLNFCRVVQEEGRYQVVEYLGVDMNRVYAQLGMEPPRPPSPEIPMEFDEESEEATGSENNNCKLWEKGHPDGGRYLVDKPELRNKLTEALPKLRRLVRTTDLWAQLQSHHIMDELDVEECQEGTRAKQVDKIIKFLQQSEVWRTHAFFRSLAQIDQAGVIDMVLGDGHRKPYMVNIRR